MRGPQPNLITAATFRHAPICVLLSNPLDSNIPNILSTGHLTAMERMPNGLWSHSFPVSGLGMLDLALLYHVPRHVR